MLHGTRCLSLVEKLGAFLNPHETNCMPAVLNYTSNLSKGVQGCRLLVASPSYPQQTEPIKHFTLSVDTGADNQLVVPSKGVVLRQLVTGESDFDFDLTGAEREVWNVCKGSPLKAGGFCKLVSGLSALPVFSSQFGTANYRDELYAKVFSRCSGSYLMALMMFGATTNILLAASGAVPRVRLTLLSTYDHVVLLYSDEVLPDVEDAMMIRLEFKNSMIVLNPVRIASKWGRALHLRDPKDNPLSPLNYLMKIVHNNVLTWK